MCKSLMGVKYINKSGTTTVYRLQFQIRLMAEKAVVFFLYKNALSIIFQYIFA